MDLISDTSWQSGSGESYEGLAMSVESLEWLLRLGDPAALDQLRKAGSA